MLTILGHGGRHCDGVTRRSFLKIGGLGLGGMSLPEILRAEATSSQTTGGATPSRSTSSHKGIIMILLVGGPPHLDMYDLKPDAPAEIRGEFKPIRTNVPGIDICELMPRTAAIMDKLVVIRSLVGSVNDHNVHQCVTGWESHPQQIGNSPDIPGYPPGGWPSIGAVLSKVYGPAVPGVPSSVDLTPVYYDARFATSANPGQPGYLGPAHAPFEVQALERQNLVLDGVGLERLADRRSLLSSLDRFRREVDASGTMQGMDSFSQQAMTLLTSSRLAEALDLDRVDAGLKKRYGVNTAAEPQRGGGALLDQFVLARRVIEAGARCVTLVFSRWPFGRMAKGDYNWDWHKNNFDEGRAALPMLDQGVATLVEDLDCRGLLDDISVVVWGEFGRTPKINGNAGRDHWPQVGSALLAGGGMRTGQVIGATNRAGEYPVERPVHFRDVFATLYHNLGIDVTTTQFTDLSGRPHFLVDNRLPIPELI